MERVNKRSFRRAGVSVSSTVGIQVVPDLGVPWAAMPGRSDLKGNAEVAITFQENTKTFDRQKHAKRFNTALIIPRPFCLWFRLCRAMHI